MTFSGNFVNALRSFSRDSCEPARCLVFLYVFTSTGRLMRRSALANHDTDHSQPSTTTIADAMNLHPQKRSLEDYGFLTNLKRRRHLSPQNANIELNNDMDVEALTPNKKKTRAKSRNQSILDASMDATLEQSSLNDTYTSRVSPLPSALHGNHACPLV